MRHQLLYYAYSGTQMDMAFCIWCKFNGRVPIQDARSRSMSLPTCPEQVIALRRYFVSNDGTSNWLMGVQLIVTYLLIAIVYFFRTG